MSKQYVILVTGSRDWTDKGRMFDFLSNLIMLNPFANGRQVVIRHGGARGADQLAGELARENGAIEDPHPVSDEEWRKSRGAGHARNARMVAMGADVCIGFPMPGSKGTWDCLKRAVDAGIPVEICNPRSTR